MDFLKVSQVNKAAGNVPILVNVSFAQYKGEKIAIAGETGSGKSSLLKIIAGLGQADSGQVIFEGNRVEGALERLVAGHPRIAYLSQDFELPKFLRVEQVLSYASSLTESESQKLHSLCQIDHLLNRKTDQLSGGERQRIALARNLITSPALLLLDEPFSNLDVIHKNTLKQVLADISSELEISLVLVSHDPLDTLSWADKILVMRAGRIIQKGSPFEIYNNPVTKYCAGLFGKYSVLRGDSMSKLGLDGKSTKKLVRPENFQLVETTTSGIQVTIKSVRFFGSFYEVQVSSARQTFIVFTTSNHFTPGSPASLQYKP